MKKYLIVSVVSITLSVILITQLYKNTDIAFVDAIVENTTSALGIKSEVVEQKIERKRVEAETAKMAEIIIPKEAPPEPVEETRPITEDPTSARVKLDSLSRLEKEQNMKKIFNAKIDNTAIEKIKEEERIAREKAIADSLALASQPKKKSLFNAVVEENLNKPNSKEETLQYFEAKVHGSQKFSDNQEVLFRTSTEIVVKGKVIPANYVFRAKANVFDGKFHFIVKSIDSILIHGQNYSNSTPGMLIGSEAQFNDGYLISDGMTLKFGIKI